MPSWSIFFLINAVFAAFVGFSGVELPHAHLARSLASVFFAAFFAFLWMERNKRNGDV